MAILDKGNNIAVCFIHCKSSGLESRFGNDNLRPPRFATIFAALRAHMAGAPGGNYCALHADHNVAKAFTLENLLKIMMGLIQVWFQWPFNFGGRKISCQQDAGKQDNNRRLEHRWRQDDKGCADGNRKTFLVVS